MTDEQIRERAERLYDSLEVQPEETCLRRIEADLRQMRDDTLDKAAKAMCGLCKRGVPLVGGWHKSAVFSGEIDVPCSAAPIHRLKGEAQCLT